MPVQRDGDEDEGSILCAWCGAVLGWAGETVYSLCKACLPLVHEAVMARRVLQPPVDAPPLPRAAGEG